MKTYTDVYSRARGPYTKSQFDMLGYRENSILDAKDCCDFPHRLNRDCDFYISDDCISYYSPTNGSFVYDYKTKLIVN